jgi:hypothetical protein
VQKRLTEKARANLNPDIDIPQTGWEFLSQFRLPTAP